METKGKKHKTKGPGKILRGQFDIIYFTDPLCCWSWGLQPQLDRLQSVYSDQMNIRYVMGGMIPSWDKFQDDVHAVSRPAQMGPMWMHAAQLIKRPINYLLWMKDPPSGSFPACIAVKSAQLQSSKVGIDYFVAVQNAAMTREKNISSWKVLEEIAGEVAIDNNIDVQQFIKQRNVGAAEFKKDLDLVATYKISRFPTLIVECAGQKSIMISGYRTFEALEETLDRAFGN